MVFYTPNGDTISQLRARIHAAGVALLFTYTLNFLCQAVVVMIPKQPSEKKLTLSRILQTSRLLYLYAVAVIFSCYPPFYQGTHSAVMAWITFLALLFMHVFCFVDLTIMERSLWAYFNFFYHLLLIMWFLLIMGFSYTWSSWQ